MNYIVYQIRNNKDEDIGKQQYYYSLSKAKCGARHCEWRMSENGNKIVQLEVTETELSEVAINVEQSAPNRYGYSNTVIKSFGDDKKISNEIESTEKIIFN